MGLESYINGRKGEERAERFLTQKGFRIIERNFRSQQGEVDLIAQDKDCLVFVEVKSYSFRCYGSPAGAVRKAKKQGLIHAAETYLYKNRIKNVSCRFDVITLYKKLDGSQAIEHYKNAFEVS
jgi:putative endonuclease